MSDASIQITKAASGARLLAAMLVGAAMLLGAQAAVADSESVTQTFSTLTDSAADGHVVAGDEAAHYQTYTRASIMGSLAELDPSVVALNADQLIHRSALLRRVVLAFIVLGIAAVAFAGWLFPRLAQLTQTMASDAPMDFGQTPRPATGTIAGDQFASAQLQYHTADRETPDSRYSGLANSLPPGGSFTASHTPHR